MSDDINIKEMPDDELLVLMGEDLYDGYADEVVEEVNELLGRGMAPYEVLSEGGSVEHWNKEPGAVWFKRLLSAFPKACWINPEEESHWRYTHSTQIIKELIEDRMFPLTVKGLESAMASLTK
jgi:uncharacterized protein with von Willebrand factor type A (vWA) domain